jgi:hypothetical protein
MVRPVASSSVRYIVDDVDAAIGFYTGSLGFTVVMHPAPAFAMLQRGDLRLVLRNEIIDGVGGRQVLVEDPSGNPVELFQPTIAEARLG